MEARQKITSVVLPAPLDPTRAMTSPRRAQLNVLEDPCRVAIISETHVAEDDLPRKRASGTAAGCSLFSSGRSR